MEDNEEAATATMENRHSEPPDAGPVLDSIDEASDASFPASDPPANTPITRVGCPCYVP